jgi:hypothetical protein
VRIKVRGRRRSALRIRRVVLELNSELGSVFMNVLLSPYAMRELLTRQPVTVD